MILDAKTHQKHYWVPLLNGQAIVPVVINSMVLKFEILGNLRESTELVQTIQGIQRFVRFRDALEVGAELLRFHRFLGAFCITSMGLRNEGYISAVAGVTVLRRSL